MVRSLDTDGIKRRVRVEHGEILKLLLPLSYLPDSERLLKFHLSFYRNSPWQTVKLNS